MLKFTLSLTVVMFLVLAYLIGKSEGFCDGYNNLASSHNIAAQCK